MCRSPWSHNHLLVTLGNPFPIAREKQFYRRPEKGYQGLPKPNEQIVIVEMTDKEKRRLLKAWYVACARVDALHATG